MTWLTAPLWGTLSYLEAAWLVLTLGCVVYLVGQVRDARAQLRAAADPVERLLARSDSWLEAKEFVHQLCFGAVGVYSALTPQPALDPGRTLGALVVTTLLMAVQVTNLLAVRNRAWTRGRITTEIRRAALTPPIGVTPQPGGRRWYDRAATPTRARDGALD